MLLSSEIEAQSATCKLVYVTVVSMNVGSHSVLLSIRQSLSLNASMSVTFVMVIVTVWLALQTIELVDMPEDKK